VFFVGSQLAVLRQMNRKHWILAGQWRHANSVCYQFRCVVCGDRFALLGDTSSGLGSWTRESEKDAL